MGSATQLHQNMSGRYRAKHNFRLILYLDRPQSRAWGLTGKWPGCRCSMVEQKLSDWLPLKQMLNVALLKTPCDVVTFSAGAEAKGCIKGAVVGGIAGSVAGHGEVGAVAGCVIGRHESNKADAAKGSQPTQPATR
jgi:uncharacterized membrane protein